MLARQALPLRDRGEPHEEAPRDCKDRSGAGDAPGRRLVQVVDSRKRLSSGDAAV